MEKYAELTVGKLLTSLQILGCRHIMVGSILRGLGIAVSDAAEMSVARRVRFMVVLCICDVCVL